MSPIFLSLLAGDSERKGLMCYPHVGRCRCRKEGWGWEKRRGGDVSSAPHIPAGYKQWGHHSPKQCLTYKHSNVPAHTQTQITWLLNLADRQTSAISHTHKMLTKQKRNHTHIIPVDTHTCVQYAHTRIVWLIYEQLPFLVQVTDAGKRTNAHTQKRRDEKWQDMSERPMTTSITSLSIFSPLVLHDVRQVSEILSSKGILDYSTVVFFE